mgnify:CR=1 FL=1
MKQKKLIFITGARPNLIKMAPIYHYIKKKSVFKISHLHTNQHNNKSLFFNQLSDLKLPFPNHLIKRKVFLSDIEMISYLTKEIFLNLKKIKPDVVILFGDVDSTLAAALASSKLYIPIIHVESGLRSKRINSKEEINRIITDRLSLINFATTKNALKNLVKEGLKKKSFYVGNIIIENFYNLKNIIKKSTIIKQLNLKENNYVLVTLHRYQNIEKKEKLKKIISQIKTDIKKIKIVFCIHPRTKKIISLIDKSFFKQKNLIVIDALPYTSFTALLLAAKYILTDSGGVLEEAYFHKKVCYVLRKDIERNQFINNVNTFLISDINKLQFKNIQNYKKQNRFTNMWDNKVSHRIFNVLKRVIN